MTMKMKNNLEFPTALNKEDFRERKYWLKLANVLFYVQTAIGSIMLGEISEDPGSNPGGAIITFIKSFY